MTTSTDSLTAEQLSTTLREVFGFDAYREGQEAVVRRLVAGKSVLAIFPTGGGKSLCYQLPALVLDDLTLVISPLIALMKDQLDFLISKGVPAARLDSTLTRDENLKLFDDLRAGILKLLYISPERLGNERFLQTIKRQKISLLAIDEAHCISEWGHNFRPDYLKIARLAEELQVERVLALTATATPDVADDVREAFHIADEDMVHTGFYRPNLKLSVVPCSTSERDQALLERMRKRPPGPTIVYVTLQKTAVVVADFLSQNGLAATAYHAGMKPEDRSAIQDQFMASDTAIIVATIAFGMGIDKANIRYVYHYNLPKGLESYSQEIGRAGRDGKTSVCEMLACAEDAIVLENFSYGDTPEAETVGAFARYLMEAGEVFDISEYELSSRFDVRPLVVKTLCTYLELDGLIASTGPFYTEYKFDPQRPSAEIFARVSGERAEFLKKIFRFARKGTKWFSLDTTTISEAIGEPRDRIIAALNYLEEKGDLILQVAGVRQGYRRLKKPGDMEALITRLNERFQQREANDIERIRKVLAFARHQGCLTQYILAYFGEVRPVCGHCAPCKGVEHPPLPEAVPSEIDTELLERVRVLMGEDHDALRTPRQRARFLCGLTSPATTRAKLRQHPLYGACEAVPFARVMERMVALGMA